jgi:3-hydroxyisobutyrate dehydrogenase
MSDSRVALLGVGTMGCGMALRLRGAGFPLTVWNRNAARAEPVRAAGATIAATPAEAAARADAIISMVSDDAASRAVWTAPDGALAAARPGAVLIECSTVSPVWVKELGALAAQQGCSFLDAPVTGSKTHAANGEMVFLVGGDPATLDRVRPVLKPMSRDVIHLGPVGSGAVMKLVNNFLSGVQAVALGQAMAFAEAAGLDRETALSVVMNGAPGSPLVKMVGPRMLARDYGVNFQLSLMRKDMSYAVAEAHRHGVDLTMAAAAREAYDRAIAAGFGDQDFAAVAETARAINRQ